VSALVGGPAGVALRARLASQAHETSRYYIVEIVTEDGEFLSVPNEAIIESGGKQVVYVPGPEGTYAARDIKVGLQGELYTHVVEGLKPGEQVVTFGSFFIDAEHRLKGS
jgi:Cu(I)/Ag(I) efflux system membrane fusion protein